MKSSKRPEIKIRFETQAQVDRIKRAAKLKQWSLNQYVITRSDEAASSDIADLNRQSKQTVNEATA
jgi:uncharacterized protein (DUF1778 family)